MKEKRRQEEEETGGRILFLNLILFLFAYPAMSGFL
jgi:hypothetical protein